MAINKVTGHIVDGKNVVFSIEEFRKILDETSAAYFNIDEYETARKIFKKLRVYDFAPEDAIIFEEKYALLETPRYDVDAEAYIAKAVNINDPVRFKNGVPFCQLYKEVWLPDDPISRPSETWPDGEIEIDITMWRF